MAKWQQTKCCGTCRFWLNRDRRDSGRVLPADGGSCTWQAPELVLPSSITGVHGWIDSKHLFSTRYCMYRDNGEDCPCYEMKPDGGSH